MHICAVRRVSSNIYIHWLLPSVFSCEVKPAILQLLGFYFLNDPYTIFNSSLYVLSKCEFRAGSPLKFKAATRKGHKCFANANLTHS